MLALAYQSFTGALRRQTLAATVGACLLGLLVLTTTLIQVQMSQAGDDESLTMRLLTRGLTQILQTWHFFGWILAVVLGSSLISSERRGRTLANLLSKPVGRPSILIGKFVGSAGALVSYLAFGYALGLAIWLAVGTDGVRSSYFAAGLRSITFCLAFMAIAAMLAQWMPALAAGAASAFLVILHPFLGSLTNGLHPAVALLAKPLYALLPASWPSVTYRFAEAAPVEGYGLGLVSKLAAENVLYAALAVGIAAWTFARKQQSLR